MMYRVFTKFVRALFGDHYTNFSILVTHIFLFVMLPEGKFNLFSFFTSILSQCAWNYMICYIIQ